MIEKKKSSSGGDYFDLLWCLTTGPIEYESSLVFFNLLMQ